MHSGGPRQEAYSRQQAYQYSRARKGMPGGGNASTLKAHRAQPRERDRTSPQKTGVVRRRREMYTAVEPSRRKKAILHSTAARSEPITCGRTAGATAADPATSTCTMRATCVLTAVPVATAGRAPAKNLFALTPPPPPPPPPATSSRATAAMPVGPDEAEIENDADRLGSDRPPLLAPSAASAATARGIEEAEAVASGAENAGGERRYRSGAKAPDSLNARLHTCRSVLGVGAWDRSERGVYGGVPERTRTCMDAQDRQMCGGAFFWCSLFCALQSRTSRCASRLRWAGCRNKDHARRT